MTRHAPNPKRRDSLSPVKLRYDSPDHVEAGFFLQTRRRTTYLVQKAKRGRTGMWNLVCVRWSPDEVVENAVVLPLFWLSRSPRTLRMRPLLTPVSKRPLVDVDEEHSA